MDDPAIAQARQALERGAPDRAAERCREVLRRDPTNGSALSLLGRLYVDSGALFAGIALLERARTFAENDPAILVRLADALDAAGDEAGAEPLLRRAIELAPNSRGAWITWGRFLQFDGRASEAVAALRRAVQIDADHAMSHVALSGALFAAGAMQEARVAFDRASGLRTGLASGLVTVAQIFERRGQHARAIATLDHALAMRPDDPEVAYARDALVGVTRHDRAPAAYVTSHFDGFAHIFDSRLRDDLDYTVPETITALIRRHVAEDASALDVMDAGCGTGLCGPGLRPLARRLAGVDLSPEMLKLAARRSVYDELVNAEIADLLRQRPGSQDLVIAADVLMYFGSLDELFAAVHQSLRPCGLFAASIEGHDGDGYVLRRSGRWAHSVGELRRAATSSRFVELSLEPTQLRKEFGAPVTGYLALFRCAASADQV